MTVYVILDHSTDPDQLRERVYYSSRRQADFVADEMRRQKGCPHAAIEVVFLTPTAVMQ